MKKNYNLFSKRSISFFRPPGDNSIAIDYCPNFVKKSCMLLVAFLFMFTTTKTFAQDGDTCANAINLATLTSPYSSTTVGATHNYSIDCAGGGNVSPDLFFFIEVPQGYTLVIGQTFNNYDSVTYIGYGEDCPGTTSIACFDDDDYTTTTWENTTGSTQIVFWVQDGYRWDDAAGDFTLAWSLTAPPTCNIPTAVLATLTSATSANVSWGAPVTGTAIDYEYAVTQTEAPPASGTVTTATSITGITVPVNVYSYLHVRTNCGTTDGYSEWVTYRFYTGYCLPAPIFVDGTGITNVTIGTSINNTTGAETNNYGDFSSQIVNVGQGVTQPFSITFTTYSTNNVRIWVDWNDDLDFTDEGEEIYSGLSPNGNPVTLTGTFTVPATAALGNHRLRIGSTASWNAINPCYINYYGSFEDYTINVTDPPLCFTPTTPAGIATASGVANLSWAAPTLGGTPTGYEYAVTTDTTPPASGTATTATSVTGYTGIEDNIYYYLYVRTNCGASGYSDWVVSARFRYLQGDTCANAVNLETLTSPYSSSTIGATHDFTNGCSWPNTAPDLFYYIEVPHGYTLTIGQTTNNYDSTNYVGYGGACPGETVIACWDDADEQTFTWENTTGSTQTVYWVQDGYNVGAGDFTIAWSLIAPPACNIPRDVTAAMTSLTSADISWAVPNTGTPTGYEYAVTDSETPPASGTATTTLSIDGVTTTANAYNYVHVRTNCGTDGYSEWVTYRFYSGHCIPNALYTGYNILSFSTTVGFSNISNTTAQTAFYTNNYNAMTVSQEPGGSFNFSATVPGYTGIDIWVDWNNDLDFDDEGEHVIANNNYGFNNTIYTGSITVPATAAEGNYRMRVRSHYYYYESSPCAEYTYGVAQDYKLAVTAPPTCYTPINITGVGIASGTANLSWAPQPLGTTPVGYEYFVSTSAISPESGTATTATSVTGYTPITDNTWYYLHVRTNCGNGDYSQWAVSLPFRYLQGDTCDSAINLSTLTSPYSYSTVGAGSDYSIDCANGNSSPDLFYYIEVPNGYTITIGQTYNNYDSENYLGYGGACPGTTSLACFDDDDYTTTTWENLTGSTQTLYWIQDGWNAIGNAGDFTLAWTLVGPVTCDKPRELDVNLTSLTTGDISWIVPNTGSPIGYEYAITTSPTPPESGTYTTELSVTGVAVTPNVASYLHVRSVCGDEDGNSIWVTYSFFSGYCPANNYANTTYSITSISTTGGETNFTNTTGFATGGYGDYTQGYSASTYAGGSFTITATHPSGTYVYGIWVDWNNNFDFTDDGERIRATPFLTSPATIATVTVPMGTAIGSYRMRIRNANIGSPVPACGNINYGETEDYTLTVVATPTCFPPYGVEIVPQDATIANLTWSAPVLGTLPTTYEYALTSSATPPTEGTITEATYIFDVPFNPAVNNYLYVRSVCGEGEYSAWVSNAILNTGGHELTENSVMVYQEGKTINITAGTTLITGVTIYDTRGRKLYTQTDINAAQSVIDNLQVQQQVLILEINTEKGKVSKRIVY